MDKPLNIFILAAGLGERLQPITHHIPKPLLPILGKPVLQYILEKVSSLSVDKIGINLHHKREIISDWISRSAFSNNVELFPEEPILGTGGALKNADAFLGKCTFITHNSDILSDIDLSRLVEFHVSSKNLATLAVHDYPQFNSVILDENGFFKGINRSGHLSGKIRKMAFTGIAVYEPEFMKFLSAGASSVVDAWQKALDEGYGIGTLDVSGCYWKDIGTPASYSSAVLHFLRSDGETFYMHPSIEGCGRLLLDGYVVIEEQGILERDASLRNCIMLPRSRAESSAHYKNCILGPGFKIDIKESEMLGLSGYDEHLLIGTGGSDRKYFRVKKDKNTAVLMQCTSEDPDFQRHIEYTRFFLTHSVPVPQLKEIDSDRKTAEFEDLGDLSLYSWLKCPRDGEQVEEMYKRVIDILVLIHTGATESVSECRLLQDRVFDYGYFRWETGYFIERFIESVKKIRVKNLSGLNDEFHRLALKADSFPKTIIHRDFQSQNIMITNGKTPRIIDFQGARIGPPAYDVVSILWDPYYRLQSAVREKLFNYYIDEMTDKFRGEFREKDFMATLLPCRLQRHMQALGAYGFLSTIKGKKYFSKFIPEGLKLLKEDLCNSKEEYPILYELVTVLSGGF